MLILYAPDIATAKEKFIYATSKDEVKKKLSPFNKEIQVNDWADLNEESFIKYFKHWMSIRYIITCSSHLEAAAHKS